MHRMSWPSRIRLRVSRKFGLNSRLVEIALDLPAYRRPMEKRMSTGLGAGTALVASGLVNISGVYEVNGSHYIIAITSYLLGRSEIRQRITRRLLWKSLDI
jgi:hypothetical protein